MTKHKSRETLKLVIALFLSLLLKSVCTAQLQLRSLDDYTLVWSDEFSGTGSPNTDLWFHQTQLPNGGSWFNGELQHYTSRTANSVVDNGVLKILARKENFTDQGQTKQYTSARLNSKFAFRYGRVDVRAKLPTGAGTWPAIWMLGQNIIEPGGYFSSQFGRVNWPACGEIDIMEHWGNNPDVIHGTIHTPSSFGASVNTRTQRLSQVSTNFYIYSIIWDESKIEFLINNSVFYTYSPQVKNSNTWPFDKPQYLLLNIAMGGTGGAIDPNFTESAMEIDYVRIYQKGNAPPSNTQTITFPQIPDQLISGPPFQLTATASSNLPVQYSTNSDKVNISGNTVTITAAGRAVIRANQPGSSTIAAAPEVSQSFCIKPVQPLVTLSGINSNEVTLTSNATAGNQWFLDGTAIPNAIATSLLVSTPGIYKVRVVADDCFSDFSNEIPLVVTGDASKPMSNMVLYPNPVEDFFDITGVNDDLKHAIITDVLGHQVRISLTKLGDVYRANTRYLAPGVYVVRLYDGKTFHSVRIVKP